MYELVEKAPNLGNLFSYRLSEPLSGEQVMECPKDPMPEIKFLDVPDTSTVGHIFNLKPCVEACWNSVLKG